MALRDHGLTIVGYGTDGLERYGVLDEEGIGAALKCDVNSNGAQEDLTCTYKGVAALTEVDERETPRSRNS